MLMMNPLIKYANDEFRSEESSSDDENVKKGILVFHLVIKKPNFTIQIREVVLRLRLD